MRLCAQSWGGLENATSSGFDFFEAFSAFREVLGEPGGEIVRAPCKHYFHQAHRRVRPLGIVQVAEVAEKTERALGSWLYHWTQPFYLCRAIEPQQSITSRQRTHELNFMTPGMPPDLVQEPCSLLSTCGNSTVVGKDVFGSKSFVIYIWFA